MRHALVTSITRDDLVAAGSVVASVEVIWALSGVVWLVLLANPRHFGRWQGVSMQAYPELNREDPTTPAGKKARINEWD